MLTLFPTTLIMTEIAGKDFISQWKAMVFMQDLTLPGDSLLVYKTVLEDPCF